MSRAPRALRRPGRHWADQGSPRASSAAPRPARPATPARVGSAATRSGPRPCADDRRRRADREFRLASDHGEGEIDLGRRGARGRVGAARSATGDVRIAARSPVIRTSRACAVGACRSGRAGRCEAPREARRPIDRSPRRQSAFRRFRAIGRIRPLWRCRASTSASTTDKRSAVTSPHHRRRVRHRRPTIRTPTARSNADRRGSCLRGLPATTDRLSAGSPATPTVTLRGHA